jgi:hypothetical protein
MAAPRMRRGRLVDPQQEPTGDYGYDEVHADVRRPSGPADAPKSGPGRGPARQTPELDQDYGYDEAHSF